MEIDLTLSDDSGLPGLVDANAYEEIELNAASHKADPVWSPLRHVG